MGYDVLALDISSIATEYARTHPPDDEMWIRVFGLATADGERYYRTQDPSLAVKILEEAAATAPLPGDLSFKQADLFTSDYLQETWDIIIAEHILDFYGAEDRRILSGRMFEALSQNGLMIVASSLLGEYEDSGIVFGSELSAVGFAVHSDRCRSDLSEITHAMDGRVAICRFPTV